jgi:DNA-binding CsgD family transcriptional regulator
MTPLGFPDVAEPSPLTRRETELARLIAEGLTNKECAWRMGCTVKTADSHRTRMMVKIRARSAQDVTRWAIRRGLVEP